MSITVMDLETLGREIARRRRARGMTPTQLARLVNGTTRGQFVGTRFINELEAGDVNLRPPFDVIMLICSRLGIRFGVETTEGAGTEWNAGPTPKHNGGDVTALLDEARGRIAGNQGVSLLLLGDGRAPVLDAWLGDNGYDVIRCEPDPQWTPMEDRPLSSIPAAGRAMDMPRPLYAALLGMEDDGGPSKLLCGKLREWSAGRRFVPILEPVDPDNDDDYDDDERLMRHLVRRLLDAVTNDMTSDRRGILTQGTACDTAAWEERDVRTMTMPLCTDYSAVRRDYPDQTPILNALQLSRTLGLINERRQDGKDDPDRAIIVAIDGECVAGGDGRRCGCAARTDDRRWAHCMDGLSDLRSLSRSLNTIPIIHGSYDWYANAGLPDSVKSGTMVMTKGDAQSCQYVMHDGDADVISTLADDELFIRRPDGTTTIIHIG